MNADERNPIALPLFEPENSGPKLPDKFGQAAVVGIVANSILTPATGFMKAYDFTLNPYTGCSFGCTYCYAAFFAREQELRDRWGYWVHVKSNSVSLLKRFRRSLRGKTIYMSSVTDPYQPIENELKLVRALLEELIVHQPKLVVQTRSPLVVRDIDLFARLAFKQVNMTVTTDSDRIRKTFEPFCAATFRRLEAIQQVQAAGIPACITLTPLLPLENPRQFARQLRATGVPRFVVQPFHVERGKFVAGTRETAKKLFAEMKWDAAAYRKAVDVLREELPDIREGREGFAPI
jgi:DNA repair photolyase